MRSFWFDPYLWIHLAGLVMVPILLEVCLLGLAVGDPGLPVWLELLLVAMVGIGPVLWMQLQRPFYIFSAIAVALQPAQLTDDQRRILTLGKSPRHRIVAIAVAIALLPILWQLYYGAAIAAPLAPLPPSARWLGLLLSAIALLFTHLFLQVPFGVLGVMLHRESDFAATLPYPLEAIASSFTIPGFQIRQILPPVVVPSMATKDVVGPGGRSFDGTLEDDPWVTAVNDSSDLPSEVASPGIAAVLPKLQPNAQEDDPV
jgi:hypothetical protein